MKSSEGNTIVCVVGLGYVGMPLAEAFAKNIKVIGFDIDQKKVNRLRLSNGNPGLTITDSPREIGKADFVIICVPTPVTKSKEPDLFPVQNAATIVAQNMKKGSVVVLESTVYPAVTDEIVKPIF